MTTILVVKQKLGFWLTLTGMLIITLIGSTYLYLVKVAPLEFKDIDIDQNGFITFSELIYVNNYTMRKITVDNKLCTETIALKNNARLKLDCLDEK